MTETTEDALRLRVDMNQLEAQAERTWSERILKIIEKRAWACRLVCAPVFLLGVLPWSMVRVLMPVRTS